MKFQDAANILDQLHESDPNEPNATADTKHDFTDAVNADDDEDSTDATSSPLADTKLPTTGVRGGIGLHAEEAAAETPVDAGKSVATSAQAETQVFDDEAFWADPLVATVYDAEETEEQEEVNLADDDSLEVDVALDTGCVAHCAGPKQLPPDTPVVKPEGVKLKGFVAANNTPIENYGMANVIMEQADGSAVGGSFQVVNVSRALHSGSAICDAASRACPGGHEVLTTARGAVVVPAGSLSRFLGQVRHIAKYPRRGGLYVAKMRIRNPKAKQSFQRPGPGR